MKSNLILAGTNLYNCGHALIILFYFKVSILKTSTSNSPSGKGPKDCVIHSFDVISLTFIKYLFPDFTTSSKSLYDS